MPKDWNDLFGGLGSSSGIGEEGLVSTRKAGEKYTDNIDVTDFAAGYAGVEQFQGEEAANQWAINNAAEYQLDPNSVREFLEQETFDASAMINQDVDFTVGGTDTDLETEGFQASDPGKLIVTGDIDTTPTIIYPDDIDIFGESAGTTVTAGQEYGTPDLVVGETVSGDGGITILNPRGLVFGSDSVLFTPYNVLAGASKTIPLAGQAATDIGDGMDGETWIAMYEGVLPDEYVAMVAEAFGIPWSPKTEVVDEPPPVITGTTTTGTTTTTPGGIDYTSTVLGGTGGGPGSTVPDLGYFTPQGYGPFFTPDSSYSSLNTFVSPYTGNPLATLFDVGFNPNQFFGGPPTMTTNQPLSQFGYTEDTFAPPVGGIFNLDSFRDSDLKGITFGDYKPAGTSVITGGGNAGTIPGGGIGNVFGGTGGNVFGGTGTTGLINTGVTTGFTPPGADVITGGSSSSSSDGFKITGDPFIDGMILTFGGKFLWDKFFGEDGYATTWGSKVKSFFTGDKLIDVGNQTVYNWGPEVMSDAYGGVSITPLRQGFEYAYNNIDNYNAMVKDGLFTGTFKEYNQKMFDSFEKLIRDEFGEEVWAKTNDVIAEKTLAGHYEEPFETEEGSTDTTLKDGDLNLTIDQDFLDSINFTGNASLFLTGLQSAGFDITTGGTKWGSVTSGPGSGYPKLLGEGVAVGTRTMEIVDANNITKYPDNAIGDTVYLGEAGEILTGMDLMNAQVGTFFASITPEFMADALETVGTAIPPGVSEALTIIAQIGAGIEGLTESLKFIDDPEPETALRAASGWLAASGQIWLALAVKGLAEVVDAIFGGYDQQPHNSVYANLDFDEFEPFGYSQGDYNSDRSAGEGMNAFMTSIMSDLMLDDLKALEDEYGIDIKGDLQLHYSSLDGFFYTIGNEDVTGFLERLDARDGGTDIPPQKMYRVNLGTLDFQDADKLTEQLAGFKETIMGDIRKALDAGYTDFSDFQWIMREIGLSDQWESFVEKGWSNEDIIRYIIASINPATGTNEYERLLDWAIVNEKIGPEGIASLYSPSAAVNF